MRTLCDKALYFGAEALFTHLLPLLLSHNIQDQKRHIMVKIIDRVLSKLRKLVRPFVSDILIVIAPLLIDDDRLVREEGRELVANLSRAAGLRTMISALRPNIDTDDTNISNMTSRAFAVVAWTLGISA